MHTKFVNNIAAEGTVYLSSKSRILSSRYKILSKTFHQNIPNQMLTNTVLVNQLGMCILMPKLFLTHQKIMLYSKDALVSEFCKMERNICGSSVWNWLLDFWRICETLLQNTMSKSSSLLVALCYRSLPLLFGYISSIYLDLIKTLCFKSEISWQHGPGSTMSQTTVVSDTHPNTSAHKPLLTAS